MSEAGAADVLDALAQPRRGEIYDLDPGRWPGMPQSKNHPPFVVTTWRSPSGLALTGQLEGRKAGHTSELIMGTAHTGTHIDALGHLSCGPDHTYHGGYVEGEILGDFGPMRGDAASIPPIVCRGVLADIAGLYGVAELDAAHEVTAEDLRRALDARDLNIQQGDAVLLRTGWMRHWLSGAPEVTERPARPGVGAEAAQWLGEAGAALVGSDTDAFDQMPSEDPLWLPAHVELLQRRGIHIIENAYLEQLAADGPGAFLFVCLPLRIRGATGSQVRPIAIV